MSDNLPLNICRTVSDEFGKQKSATVMHQLQSFENEEDVIDASMMHQFVTPGKTIISHLSFTHLREIMTLGDPLARYFYEQECIKCTQRIRISLSRERNATRRQSSYRHSPLHSQGKENG